MSPRSDRKLAITATLLCFAASGQTTMLALQVRNMVLAGNTGSARLLLDQVRKSNGTVPAYIEALSWIGRGALNARNYAEAESNGEEVRKLCLDQLAHRKLDAEPALPMALSASIEIQTQVAVEQGRRDQAVAFLRTELKRWYATSIRARIQKNLNLLTLEGKPAPPLDVTHALTPHKLQTLAQHRGHPILLFFWAHWCSDCKNEIPIITRVEQVYGKRGLQMIAPTQHYGYVAGGQDASPAIETPYIKAVYQQYYAGLGDIEIPLSEENFANYGVSTTPTIVLIDSQGIVRLYNPGNIPYDQLAAKVESVLRAS